MHLSQKFRTTLSSVVVAVNNNIRSAALVRIVNYAGDLIYIRNIFEVNM